MRIERIGSDPYDSCSANGWFVMKGDEAIAGPFIDAAVAFKRMQRLTKRR
jgi:hypothetical protein